MGPVGVGDLDPSITGRRDPVEPHQVANLLLIHAKVDDRRPTCFGRFQNDQHGVFLLAFGDLSQRSTNPVWTRIEAGETDRLPLVLLLNRMGDLFPQFGIGGCRFETFC